MIIDKLSKESSGHKNNNNKNKKKEVKWSALEAHESNPMSVENSFEGVRQPVDPQDANAISKSCF